MLGFGPRSSLTFLGLCWRVPQKLFVAWLLSGIGPAPVARLPTGLVPRSGCLWLAMETTGVVVWMAVRTLLLQWLDVLRLLSGIRPVRVAALQTRLVSMSGCLRRCLRPVMEATWVAL